MPKKIITSLLAISICLYQPLNAQDTLVIYEPATQTLILQSPIAYDTTLAFASTAHSTGTLSGTANFDLTAPATNVYPNTQYTQSVRAATLFNLEDYPVRTAVKLKGYSNGIPQDLCSGMLVGPSFVLSATHCLYNRTQQTWNYDSIWVIPAYDNGQPNPSLPTAKSYRYIIPKVSYDGTYLSDVGFIQLAQPIGSQIGWIGMAYTTDTAFFQQKNLHKFSYPNTAPPANATLPYNGDTLYYDYGLVQALNPDFLAVPNTGSIGAQGQSGSSWFYTDNQQYYSLGVLSYSNLYRHTRISPSIFHTIKYIIEQTPLGTKYPAPLHHLQIFPNPTLGQFQVRVPLPQGEVEIYDLMGRIVSPAQPLLGGEVSVDGTGWEKGMYVIRVQHNGEVLAQGKLIIQ